MRVSDGRPDPDQPPSDATGRDGALRVNFAWLIRLRFGAVVGQVVAVLVTQFALGWELPLAALFGVMALELGVNVWALVQMRAGRAIRAAHVAASIGLDVVLFSALLFFSGGPANPFSFLYLVHIALAAIMLPQRTSFALVGLALACSLGLFFASPSSAHDHAHHHQGYAWHLRGMWVAFAVGASVIVYLIQRVRHELEGIERKLRVSRERATRNEHAAVLAMLSAGAAHELGSPLSTIALASSEVLRSLPPDAGRAQSDLLLIRSEVARCRDIIDQLSVDAGAIRSGTFASLSAASVVDAAVAGMAEQRVVRRSGCEPGVAVVGPLRALAQALRNLVKNALDASGPSGVATVEIAAAQGEVWFIVEDAGTGMTPEVLARATEPFFTTKSRGEGMGLGLFLARSVAEQMGGRLELSAIPSGGTRAVLALPRALAAVAHHDVSPEPALLAQGSHA
jgi:two-component system, sensor histidine kinase RegB